MEVIVRPSQIEKIKTYVEYVYAKLDSGLLDRHEAYVMDELRDAIYQQCPRIQTGMISLEAKEALERGDIVRSKLTPEHFHTRKQTSERVVSVFREMKQNGHPEVRIKEALADVYTKGSQIHWVLARENSALRPFQEACYPPEQAYRMAGVVLVRDDKEDKSNRKYIAHLRSEKRIYNTQPEIARDWMVSITTVRRWIKKGFITVERKTV